MRHLRDESDDDFTRNARSYDLIVDVKTNRSPFACARALSPKGGELAPVIDRQYTFSDVADAFRRFGAGDHKGKIVLTIGE